MSEKENPYGNQPGGMSSWSIFAKAIQEGKLQLQDVKGLTPPVQYEIHPYIPIEPEFPVSDIGGPIAWAKRECIENVMYCTEPNVDPRELKKRFQLWPVSNREPNKELLTFDNDTIGTVVVEKDKVTFIPCSDVVDLSRWMKYRSPFTNGLHIEEWNFDEAQRLKEQLKKMETEATATEAAARRVVAELRKGNPGKFHEP